MMHMRLTTSVMVAVAVQVSVGALAAGMVVDLDRRSRDDGKRKQQAQDGGQGTPVPASPYAHDSRPSNLHTLRVPRGLADVTQPISRRVLLPVEPTRP